MSLYVPPPPRPATLDFSSFKGLFFVLGLNAGYLGPPPLDVLDIRVVIADISTSILYLHKNAALSQAHGLQHTSPLTSVFVPV